MAAHGDFRSKSSYFSDELDWFILSRGPTQPCVSRVLTQSLVLIEEGKHFPDFTTPKIRIGKVDDSIHASVSDEYCSPALVGRMG